MRKSFACLVALSALVAGTLLAQDHDITGTWQGTLHTDKDLRIVMKVSKADAGGLKAVMYSIDQNPQPIPAAITLQGTDRKDFGGRDQWHLRRRSSLNTDGTTITGIPDAGSQRAADGPDACECQNRVGDSRSPRLGRSRYPKAPIRHSEVATIKPTQEGTPFEDSPDEQRHGHRDRCVARLSDQVRVSGAPPPDHEGSRVGR